MKILVIGDYIADHYVFGKVERLCPEAPVPVFVPTASESRAGGAGLVAANIEALGAEPLTLYGSFSEKTRYFADNHLLLRVDKDSSELMPIKEIPSADAIVVSDYGKGAVPFNLARTICMESKVPVFVDAKRNWDAYAGSFAAFPNQNESTVSAFHQHVIQKLGSQGCSVDGVHVPIAPRKVYDVTGAGDVFMAAFVVEYMRTSDLMAAAHFANDCAGESVEHLGSYVVKDKSIHMRKA